MRAYLVHCRGAGGCAGRVKFCKRVLMPVTCELIMCGRYRDQLRMAFIGALKRKGRLDMLCENCRSAFESISVLDLEL